MGACFLYINTNQGLALSRRFPAGYSLFHLPRVPQNQPTRERFMGTRYRARGAEKSNWREEFVFFKATSLRMTGR